MFDATEALMMIGLGWLAGWLARRVRVRSSGWLQVSWGEPAAPPSPPLPPRSRRLPAGEVGVVSSGAVKRRPRSGAKRP